jgi:hypothetical protein
MPCLRYLAFLNSPPIPIHISSLSAVLSIVHRHHHRHRGEQFMQHLILVLASLATDPVITVPEPSAFTLLAIGAVSLIGYGLFQKKRAIQASSKESGMPTPSTSHSIRQTQWRSGWMW